MEDKSNLLLTERVRQVRHSRWAIASVTTGALAVLSLLAILAPPLVYLNAFFPVAIVSGHVALSRMRRSPQMYKGRGMAVMGLCVGYFFLFVFILYFAAAVFGSS